MRNTSATPRNAARWGAHVQACAAGGALDPSEALLPMAELLRAGRAEQTPTRLGSRAEPRSAPLPKGLATLPRSQLDRGTVERPIGGETHAALRRVGVGAGTARGNGDSAAPVEERAAAAIRRSLRRAPMASGPPAEVHPSTRALP